jgi:hypothetical protein
VGRACQFTRWTTKEGQQPTKVPGNLVDLLHAAGEWPAIPHLEAVSRRPVLLASGDVVASNGYDERTRTLYDFRHAWPAPASSVSRDEAQANARAVLHPFRGFPLVDGRDRGGLLAALLTLAARETVDGSVPMFAVSGDQMAVGKTKLTQAATAMMYGHLPVVVGAKSTAPDELDKTVFAALRDESPSIVVDNATRPVGSEFLASMLTAGGRVSGRVLGESRLLTLRWRGVLWSTGNGLQLAEDCQRRAIVIRLCHGAPGAERRRFDFDPVTEAQSAWVELRSRAVDVLRAYMQAGAPDPVGTLGSYEPWWRLIVGAVQWLDLDDCATPHVASDPYGNQVDDAPDDLDEDTDQLRTACLAWREYFGDTALTADDALSRLRATSSVQAQEVVTALHAMCRTRVPLDGRDLGYGLRRVRAKWAPIRGGLHVGFRPQGKQSNNVTRWAVVVERAGSGS